MNWMRPYQKLTLKRGGGSNPLFARLEGTFERLLSPSLCDKYLQSREAAGDDPASTPPPAESGAVPTDPLNRTDLGPTERSLLHYFNGVEKGMAAIVGDLGSGKSTTLSHVLEHLVDHSKTSILLHDFNNYVPKRTTSDEIVETSVITYLASVFSSMVRKLLAPSEEYVGAWTWAMSAQNSQHPSIFSLEGAFKILRKTLGDEWKAETSNAIEARKAAAVSIDNDVETLLRYQIMLLDYFVSNACSGDGRRLIVAFDNLDPLPSNYQRSLFEQSIRLSNYAPFKFALAMRPATFKRRIEAASGFTTYTPIIHCGPSLESVIRGRISTLINADDDELSRACAPVTLPFSVRIDGVDTRIGAAQIRSFCANVMTGFEKPRYAMDGQSLVEGVAGDSIRLGLVLAGKVFSGSAFSLEGVIGGDGRNAMVKRHEIDRCVLLRGKPCFTPTDSRIVDNIFESDAGDEGVRGNITCKIRLLYFLRRYRERGIPLGEVDYFLRLFGYPSQTVVGAVNSILHPTRRLAISDSILQVARTDEVPNLKLQITPAGSFYIDTAMRNLEYIQEVYYGTELPSDLIFEHDPRNFQDRIHSLSMFLGYLADVDLAETRRCVMEVQTEKYVEIFGRELISLLIMRSIEPALKRVADAIVKNRRSGDRSDVDAAIYGWQHMFASKTNAAADLLLHIRGHRHAV
jgi:hypothetical protein